jgi:hypothetical protein
LELGVYTFADVSPDANAKGAIRTGKRLRNLLEEIELADQAGLDVFRNSLTRSCSNTIFLATAAS